MFTGDWCGPCKVIKPIFEELAKRSALEPPVTFVLVDTTAGREIAQTYAISAVPTFMFFLKGKKQDEIKGADATELRTQVKMLAMTAYPEHSHHKLKLSQLHTMSTAPILYEQKPNFDAALAKLSSFLSDDSESASSLDLLKGSITLLSKSAAIDITKIRLLVEASYKLLKALQPAQYFPLLDILRFAVLDARMATVMAETFSDGQNLVLFLLLRASSSELPKPTLTTLLKFLSNSLLSPILSSSILKILVAREQMTQILVKALLEPDKSVRTFAGSLAYSTVGWLRKQRTTWVDEDASGSEGYSEQEEFEMELCTAILESLDREEEPEVGQSLVTSVFN